MRGVKPERAALMRGVKRERAALMCGVKRERGGLVSRALACVLSFMAALSGAATSAQEVQASSQQLRLAGTAPPACVLSAPVVDAASNASFAVTGASSAQIAITQLVDTQTATSLASEIELSLPVTCNAANTVTVRTTNGGLRRVGAPANAAAGSTAGGGFSEFLGYRLGLDWAGQSRDQASTAGGATIASPQPGRGNIVLRVATAAGSGPLVAGRYDDAIVVEIHAAN